MATAGFHKKMPKIDRDFLRRCLASNQEQLASLLQTRENYIEGTQVMTRSLERETELMFLRSLMERELELVDLIKKYEPRKRQCTLSNSMETEEIVGDIPLHERPFF